MFLRRKKKKYAIKNMDNCCQISFQKASTCYTKLHVATSHPLTFLLYFVLEAPLCICLHLCGSWCHQKL